jgi:hypothetical protein
LPRNRAARHRAPGARRRRDALGRGDSARLGALTLERVRLRLAARTNDLHCHMSLGAPSLVSLIDVNSSGVPLFAPLAAGAEHADWLHVAYTHATHQQPSLRIALKPASLVFAPLLFNRLARVASIIEPYTRAAAVTHEHNGAATPSTVPLGDSDGDVIAPLTRDEAAEAARLVSRRLDASFHRVALNELSALARARRRRRCQEGARLGDFAACTDCAGRRHGVGRRRATRVRLQGDQCRQLHRPTLSTPTPTMTQFCACRRRRCRRRCARATAAAADRARGVCARAAGRRWRAHRRRGRRAALQRRHAVVRELEAMMSRASLQWNNGVDANEHVWRAPTASRPSNVNAQRRRAPRVIANWRPLLTPHLRRRADTTYYRASVLAKSVVLALGAPDAPVAELRADGVCVTASGHARGGRDCTRFALSISEAAVVELDGTLEHVLLSASAVAQVASPPSARSLYATPAAPLDRTMYGTPLGRSFVAPPPMTASRFGLDSMRLDSPFRAAHSVMAPEFDDEHHSRAAALGAPFPFQAEQRFMSPDSSLLVGTPQRGGWCGVRSPRARRRRRCRRFVAPAVACLASCARRRSLYHLSRCVCPTRRRRCRASSWRSRSTACAPSICNRGFAAIERALAAPPSTVPRATQQARLESLTAGADPLAVSDSAAAAACARSPVARRSAERDQRAIATTIQATAAAEIDDALRRRWRSSRNRRAWCVSATTRRGAVCWRRAWHAARRTGSSGASCRSFSRRC